MLDILAPLLMGFAGVYLINLGADWLTDAAIPLARRLGTSSVAVGLIVVSFLLSLPEIMVALSSIARGHPGIGFGVVSGSILADIGLVIGLAAMVKSFTVDRLTITRDGIFMAVVTIVVAILASDLQISKSEGLVLMLLFVPYVINVFEDERGLTRAVRKRAVEGLTLHMKLAGKMIYDTRIRMGSGILPMLAGTVILIIGSELFTGFLISLSEVFNISDILIGVSIGAIGPTLPNIAVALKAARKNYDELIISEAVGSNIFTLMITLGIVSVLQPMIIPETALNVTIPLLLMNTFVLLFFMIGGRMTKKEGRILVGLYLLSMALETIVHL